MRAGRKVLGVVLLAAAATGGSAFTSTISRKGWSRPVPCLVKMSEDAFAASEGTTSTATENLPDIKANKEMFDNDGLFSWMQSFFLFHEDGKSMKYFVPVDADSTSRKTPEQVAAQKREFSKDLMNIGMEERERRRNAGDIFTVVTAAYVCWAALVVDQGDLLGHILRFLSVLPLFFAVGLKESADRGL